MKWFLYASAAFSVLSFLGLIYLFIKLKASERSNNSIIATLNDISSSFDKSIKTDVEIKRNIEEIKVKLYVDSKPKTEIEAASKLISVVDRIKASKQRSQG